MTSLTSAMFRKLFVERNSTLKDMPQEVLIFPFFFMQLKHGDNLYSKKNEPLMNLTESLTQSTKQTVSFIKPQIYTQNEVTGIMLLSPDLEDYDNFIICPALTTTQRKQNTVLINNFLGQPYTKRNPPCYFVNNKTRENERYWSSPPITNASSFRYNP